MVNFRSDIEINLDVAQYLTKVLHFKVECTRVKFDFVFNYVIIVIKLNSDNMTVRLKGRWLKEKVNNQKEERRRNDIAIILFLMLNIIIAIYVSVSNSLMADGIKDILFCLDEHIFPTVILILFMEGVLWMITKGVTDFLPKKIVLKMDNDF